MNKKYIFLTILLVYKLLFPQSIFAKEYSIDGVNIQAFLNQDGSMSVTEERRFNFQGDYRFVYQSLNKQVANREPYILSDFKLCEKNTVICYKPLEKNLVNFEEPRNNPNNTFVIDDRGDKYYLQWHFQANYEVKDFVLSYKVANAITRHEDVAELYWQFIGSDWEVASRKIQATIFLPVQTLASQLDSIKAFGHGPLKAQVSISALPSSETHLHYVLLETGSLPVGKFFEGRIILPKNLFLNGVEGSANQATILAEEENFIAQTINQLKKNERLSILYFALAAILFLLGCFLAVTEFLKFLKLGKDKPLKKLSGVWEPPSDSEPALVSQIMTATKTLTPKVFTATVLALVQKKLFKITRSNKKEGFFKKEYKYFLEKTNRVVMGIDAETKGARVVELAAVEKEVYEFLTRKIAKTYLKYFDEKKQEWVARAALGAAPTEQTKRRLALTDISQYIKAYPSSSFEFFKSLEKIALEEGLDQAYFERESYDYAKSFSALRVFVVPFFSFILLIVMASMSDREATARASSFIDLGIALTLLNSVIFFIVGLLFTILQQHAQKRTKKAWEEQFRGQ